MIRIEADNIKLNISLPELILLLNLYNLDDFYNIYINLPEEAKKRLYTYFSYRVKKMS